MIAAIRSCKERWTEYLKRRKLREGDFVKHKETGQVFEVYDRFSDSIILLKSIDLPVVGGRQIIVVTKEFRDENPELFI